MKKLFLISFFILFIQIFPQATNEAKGGIVRGFVADSLNGEPIIYANVFIKGTNLGSPTNTTGYYIITGIPAGEITIVYSYIGYHTSEIKTTIQAGDILQFNVQLLPSTVELEGVSVVGEKVTVKENETDIGLERISISDIKQMPKGVEADLLRALQYVTGVSTTGDVTSRYYVRGGDNEQNIVLLNGAPVYNPYHALGIFSVVDPEIASALEFYKGGFTAEYGGRLSSILDIITKDGNKRKFAGNLQGSVLAMKGAIEGPIPHGSFHITGRKSYYSEIMKKFLNNKSAPFDFYDFSFKLNYSNDDILKNSKFVIHGFNSRDDIKNNDMLKEDYFLKNAVYGVNWYQVWASPLYSYMTFSVSTFDAAIIPNLSDAKERKNSVTDLNSKWNFTYIFDEGDELGVGFQNSIFSSTLDQENLQGGRTVIDGSGLSMNLYLKYKFMRIKNFGLDIGSRIMLITISKKRAGFLEPRISATYKPFDWLTFKAAAGKYSQEVTTLSDENDLLSIFEPWIKIPDYLPPSEAWHYIAGAKIDLPGNLFLNLEGYYKDMRNITDLNENKYSANDPDLVAVNGYSYGLEAELEYRYSIFTAKAGYSLGWAWKENNGKKFHPRYDNRHALNLILGVNPGDGWNMNISWSFSSGRPYTPLDGYFYKMRVSDFWSQWYLFNGFSPGSLYGDKNSERFPFYHRLDLNISKAFTFYFMRLTLDFSIINIYDRKNIFYFDKETGERVDMLPFLPSLSLKLEL
ncbi:MAG: TonB-dependent receptor [Ignavibacteriaceae bacterium]|nr:TonB-dependent receptor [Ignavibacteriaceae bacterium]